MPLTVLPPRPSAGMPGLDEAQRAVLALRDPAVLVRGAPGSGRTTTALALVLDRVEHGLTTDEVLVLAPTRRAAAHLRDTLSAHLGRTTGRPVVRTAASAAFSVLRARAALLGEPPPALISGPEQDLVLADLLAGHAAGEGAAVTWPPSVPPEARALRGFRDELRDLLMRAAERGLRPEDLDRLGRRHGRPEWCAAARVHGEYLAVTRLRSGTPDLGLRVDPAAVVDEAAEALRAWDQEVPGAPRPRWSLVVVDDYQDATAATARLLHALGGPGTDLVLLADPDSAVQTFRGAMPTLVDRAPVGPPGSELGAFAAVETVLPTVHRHGAVLRRVVRTVTQEVRGAARSHRRAEAVDERAPAVDAPELPADGAPAVATTSADGAVRVALLRSPAQESAYVARVLRAAHLHDDVPWERMAVVVRSGAMVRDLRRALSEAHVPVEVVGSDAPLRSEPAVRPLLLALARSSRPEDLTAEDVATLLTSPLVGLDAVGLRRVRRALRREELDGGGGRTSDPLLVEAVGDPARAATLPSVARRPVAALAALLDAGRRAADVPRATALDVLWALWDAAGVAEPWRRTALAGGAAAERADRDLDAVLALFAAAEQFVDRFPRAAVTAFVEHVAAQDLPADSLAAQAAGRPAVALVTPAGAAGREWDVVVVAGVQEGTWPDLRLRDSLLGAQRLVEVTSGRDVVAQDERAEARAAVLDDEVRAFVVAVSRARHRLVVSAVDDADHQPSPLVDLVQPPPDGGPDPRRTVVAPALDLRSVVAQCRAELEGAALAGGDPGPDHPAARLLARLSRAGVAEAHPDAWSGVLPLSTTEPLWPTDATVTLSPSRLESVTTCALRWALETAGGAAADSGEQSLGTLVHEIAADLPHGDAEELAAELDRRWSRLGLPDGWVGAVGRRRGDAMVRHLAEYLAAAGETLAVEQPFQVELGDVTLRGVVDRVERVGTDEDGAAVVRVVDLKTGRSAVSAPEAARHAQLGAYQLAVEAGAFEESVGPARSAGASLVYVGRTTRTWSEREQGALAEDADPAWAADLVQEVAGTVRASAMSARANDLCRVCPVRRSCPAHEEGQVLGR